MVSPRLLMLQPAPHASSSIMHASYPISAAPPIRTLLRTSRINLPGVKRYSVERKRSGDFKPRTDV